MKAGIVMLTLAAATSVARANPAPDPKATATEDRDTDTDTDDDGLPWFQPTKVAREAQPLPPPPKPVMAKKPYGLGGRISYDALSGKLSGSQTMIEATYDFQHAGAFLGFALPSLSVTDFPGNDETMPEQTVTLDGSMLVMGGSVMDLGGIKLWSGAAGGTVCHVSLNLLSAQVQLETNFGHQVIMGARANTLGLTLQSCSGVLAQVRLVFGGDFGGGDYREPMFAGENTLVAAGASTAGIMFKLDWWNAKK